MFIILQIFQLPMGLASEEELSAARSRLYGCISTRDSINITWQEFMSYLLQFKFDQVIINANDKMLESIAETSGVESNSVKSDTAKMIKRKKKGERKVKSHIKKKKVYDSQGHLVTAEQLMTLVKEKAAKDKEKTAKDKAMAMKSRKSKDSKENFKPVSGQESKEVVRRPPPPRSFVIGSQMNSGKLGGRHLQLHVFPE